MLCSELGARGEETITALHGKPNCSSTNILLLKPIFSPLDLLRAQGVGNIIIKLNLQFIAGTEI